MERWVTIKEACVMLDMTERTLRRHIQQNKIKTKVEGKRRYVFIDTVDMVDHDQGHDPDMIDHAKEPESELLQQLRTDIEYLKAQIQEKDQQLSQQQAIIMQLSRNQQMMLESSEQKRRGWWSRFFKRF